MLLHQMPLHQMPLHQMPLHHRCPCTRCPCTPLVSLSPPRPLSHLYHACRVYLSCIYLSRSPSRTGIALVFTALCTPYEVGFLPAAEAGFPNGGRNLFIINRLIDIVFIIDMFLQFFT